MTSGSEIRDDFPNGTSSHEDAEAALAIKALAARMSKISALDINTPVVAFMEHAEELAGYHYDELPLRLHHRYYLQSDLIDCAIYPDFCAYAKDIVALSSLALRPHPIKFHEHKTPDNLWIDEARKFLERMAGERNPKVLFRQPEYVAHHKIFSLNA
ncbi:hypothetical protein KDD17_10260 [Sulfitobacter albidus]|uniref:Uncharacterized protein n=1 Tax=Sulfitobacter albidus TaxID=2829501 RepID=A0A975JBU4_9RHOB|nr:hypothetical protein [Sulfitobacter albidus]QUJ75370.1 hypothetical protein KDD17_10260 [Sulfitobacter albidus]